MNPSAGGFCEDEDEHTRSAGSAGEETDEVSESLHMSAGDRSISFTTDSNDLPTVGVSIEQHRNMMLASLLEDYYRTRAAEFLNATNPGMNYTRRSREVQPLARRLFAQAGETLTTNGLISSVAMADNSKSTRIQYLAGLDKLAAGMQAQVVPGLVDSMGNLSVGSAAELALIPHTARDLQLAFQPPRPRGHYQRSFQELKLLGKGGFGKVYMCHNYLDQKTYAVKKISISEKLGRGFSEGRQDGAQHILREVQTLALLDHSNVIRYHATWFEESQLGRRGFQDESYIDRARTGPGRQMLLNSHYSSHGSTEDEPSVSDGIVFGEDTSGVSDVNPKELVPNKPLWSDGGTEHSDVETSSDYSDLFTDGRHHSEQAGPVQEISERDDHMLYIQMTMYPTTLAEYLSSLHSSQRPAPRHCFHLGPSLQLLQSILAGVRYIHSKGYIHRDIKPGNIFLSAPEETPQVGYCNVKCNSCCSKEKQGGVAPPAQWLNPRIGDFGLVAELAHGDIQPIEELTACPADSEDPQLITYDQVGTAYYRPPSWKGWPDEKIDIFALGVVFVELMCPCSTAMERVTMLKGLQQGCLPDEIKSRIESDACDANMIDMVLDLVHGMINHDPDQRWTGIKVQERIEEILRSLDYDKRKNTQA
ncbi:kinase-like domain-containing protein [Xylariales sp. PMI_506]|nr:kinase-like domain-containing protein [Xylariales sp. PMI_506]